MITVKLLAFDCIENTRADEVHSIMEIDNWKAVLAIESLSGLP